MKNTTKLWTAGASALALACFMTPQAALAADPPAPMFERGLTATLGFYGGFSSLGNDQDISLGGSQSEDSGYPTLGGSAKVDIPFNTNTSLQLDLDGVSNWAMDGQDSSSSQSDNFAGGSVVGAHLNYREIDRFLIGIVGAAGVTHISDTSSTGESLPTYFIGIEGQWYFNNITLYGQVGYLDSNYTNSSSNEGLSDAFLGRLVLRGYFNGGRTLAQISGLYADGEQDEGGGSPNDLTVWGWGAKLQHQFANWGNTGFASVFVEYRGRRFIEKNTYQSPKYTDNTFLVGFALNLNQQTLQATERTGVALDLPDINRLVGGGPMVD
jgi:hypothetical protein